MSFAKGAAGPDWQESEACEVFLGNRSYTLAGGLHVGGMEGLAAVLVIERIGCIFEGINFFGTAFDVVFGYQSLVFQLMIEPIICA